MIAHLEANKQAMRHNVLINLIIIATVAISIADIQTYCRKTLALSIKLIK